MTGTDTDRLVVRPLPRSKVSEVIVADCVVGRGVFGKVSQLNRDQSPFAALSTEVASDNRIVVSVNQHPL